MSGLHPSLMSLPSSLRFPSQAFSLIFACLILFKDFSEGPGLTQGRLQFSVAQGQSLWGKEKQQEGGLEFRLGHVETPGEGYKGLEVEKSGWG